MPTLISFKRKMSSSDEWYNPQLKNNYSGYASNGARGVSWGGSFATNALSYLRSAKSFNTNYEAFSSFRILRQSAVVNRIGYQVIYDPVSFKDGDVEFLATKGVVIKNYSSPWDVWNSAQQGAFTFTDIDSVFQIGEETWNTRSGELIWAVDGDGNFAHYNPEIGWIREPYIYRDPYLYDFFDGRNRQSLVNYYWNIGFKNGPEALVGGAPFTAEFLIPPG